MTSKVLTTLKGALCASLVGSVFALASTASAADGGKWHKGNLHTHSLWSDGDDYPEMIADWYKSHGYSFLSYTDHNTLHDKERWIDVEKNKGGLRAFGKYEKRFPGGVETRIEKDRKQVRLRKLTEIRPLFDEPGRFVLLQSEEISARYLPGPGKKTVPIHVNATNLKELIIPQSGSSVEDVLRKNVDAVFEQRERTGQAMFPHLNHPNFHFAVTAEELMRVEKEQFFEVYNGHPSVGNEGNETYAGMERLWDIINTRRLAELGMPVLYGVGTDDGHSYHEFNPKKSNPGRGWVMVRAKKLTPRNIVLAMEAGDFYSSNGVVLKDVKRGKKKLSIQIHAEPDVTYTTHFIGTRKGYDAKHTPVKDAKGNVVRATHRYSDDIGAVLATVKGANPSYTFKGDEIYVRAKVTSSKLKKNPYREGEHEMAWVQPVVTGVK